MLFNLRLERNDAKAPLRANSTDSGLDLFALEDSILRPGETKGVRTGIKFGLKENFLFRLLNYFISLFFGFKFKIEGQIRSKSGLALRYISVKNSPGTIDFSYTGELVVILTNSGISNYSIEKDAKIAQLIYSLVIIPNNIDDKNFDNSSSERKENGFGSTGK